MATPHSVPGRHPAVLLPQSAVGVPRSTPPTPAPVRDAVLRWGRPALLPLSTVLAADTAEPVVALTYDDGPEPGQTPPLLDVLGERGARATFFVLTDRAEAHPAIVRRALAEGHEVALHGIDHTRLTRLPAREAVRRLRTAKQRLEAITGRPVRYWRPTYGALGPTLLLAARALGLDVVIWSATGHDWADGPPQAVADRVLAALHPGAVVLLHDDTDDAEARAAAPVPTFSRADVARRILDGLDGRGFASVTVGELLRRHPAVRAVTVERPRPPWPPLRTRRG